MSWQFFTVAAAFLFVAYQSLLKFFPENISPFLINAYASAVGVGLMLVLYFLTSESKSLVLSPKYLPLALVVGVLVSVANAAVIRSYGLGAPQSAFSSIYLGLFVTFGLFAGLIFFHEHINWYQGVGFVALVLGMFMITYFK